ncbi:MAG: alpha-1,2-fucosyltransferase [Lachnospiraceae bacterium]|nr:alpha-1,2-fucosyltransferase [Lachnospiraceae bacterium]
MIIIQVAGGLGNQLQQYALYRKFLSLGIEARLDISWFQAKTQINLQTKRKLELDFFDQLEYQACTPLEKKKLIGSDSLSGKIRRKLFPFSVHTFQESQIYHPEVLGFKNMYLTGYFACEMYYADILPELRELIHFKPSMNPKNIDIIKEMNNCGSVAVHIRRGDYLDQENQRLFGNICTEEYYKAAIDCIGQRYPKAHFFLFSDDTDYIRAQYQGNEYSHIDWNKDDESIYDIYLMSQCKHIICANSTFSFWGARLNKNPGKIMIRPARHKNTQEIDPAALLPLWPGWTLIDSEGKVLSL